MVGVEIQHIDTKEQIVDIFTKLLEYELFQYLRYKLNPWYINGIILCEGVKDYTHEGVTLEDSP